MARASTFGDRVACVVVTYSPGDTLAAFLDSLATATSEPVQVVISDNGSTDGMPQLAAATRDNVLLVSNPHNPGYGAAVNSGAATLGDEFGWILVCNPDLVLRPDSVDTLLAAARADSSIGSAGPSIRSLDGTLYPSARQLPSFRTGIAHALLVNTWPANPWTRRYKQDVLVNRAEEMRTGWLSGACLLIRREAFEAIGGFDESYFMYFEDVDLGARLTGAGYDNLYVPQAEVIHEGGASTSKHSTRMLAAHHESAYLYMARKHSERRWRPVLALVHVGLRLRLWVLARRR